MGTLAGERISIKKKKQTLFFCENKPFAKLSKTVEGWLRNSSSGSPLALWSYPVPHHLLGKAHSKSLTLNAALEECCDKSSGKTDHGKSGDKGTQRFEMKLVAERSLSSCSDALRSNLSPFFLAGLLIYFFLQGNFIKIDLVL